MEIVITVNTKQIPPNKLADVTLQFEHGEPLEGLMLVGIAIWEGRTQPTPYISFPARAYKADGKTKYYNFLRGTYEASDMLKDDILIKFNKVVQDADKAQNANKVQDAKKIAPRGR
jgi:hypothetical protein